MTTDEDNKRLKTELSEMKARHRLEIERVTREKEEEMDEVHKRSVTQGFLDCTTLRDPSLTFGYYNTLLRKCESVLWIGFNFSRGTKVLSFCLKFSISVKL